MSNLNAARDLLERHWGYKTFWPLQERAVESALAGHDSLVVLPTGGGKSLCYQLPALCLPGMAVVVSPLIALMKDQVDSLTSMGIVAGRLTSGMDADTQRAVYTSMEAGRLKLLYVSPERLAMRGFLDELSYRQISFFAIDEAHCISHWGHDFRPEYRTLATIRERFAFPFHAYTATATERVRQDILDQLQLRNPQVCVGSFDRPNLQYRFVRRMGSAADEVDKILKRHDGEAGIVYCITRKNVEELAATLGKRGHQVAGYHAGMTPDVRDRVQDDFMNERVNVIIATVAFGMGIDRPDVRFVAHTGLPRSVEHYQQEAGRAGRDGLPAECVIFYSLEDLKKWEYLINMATGEGGEDSRANAMELVRQMYRFADGYNCRHRSLVEYFGQHYDKSDCGACDVCLGEHEEVSGAQTIALKILSGVVRTGERYGGQYVAETLRGSTSERIVQNGDDTLTTFGILRGETLATIRSYIEQLESLGYLELAGAEYPVYRVTAAGWQLLRQRDLPVRLITPPKAIQQGRKRKRERLIEASLQEKDVPSGLFAALRDARRDIARRDGYPPYIICHDKTLILLAARRPQTIHELREIPGFGEKKANLWGEDLLRVIARWKEE